MEYSVNNESNKVVLVVSNGIVRRLVAGYVGAVQLLVVVVVPEVKVHKFLLVDLPKRAHDVSRDHVAAIDEYHANQEYPIVPQVFRYELIDQTVFRFLVDLVHHQELLDELTSTSQGHEPEEPNDDTYQSYYSN